MQYFCDNQRHLVCIPYSIENLHKMAVNLRIPLSWFHGGSKPHYDIPKKRVEEIQRFCTVVRPREILKIIKNDKE